MNRVLFTIIFSLIFIGCNEKKEVVVDDTNMTVLNEYNKYKNEIISATEPIDRHLSNNAIEYINKLRVDSGLKPYIENKILSKAASNHARYLSLNNDFSHVEKKETKGFTGEQVWDRVLYAGYHTGYSSENASYILQMKSNKDTDEIESVDGLMSGIYHRFSFLDLTTDEIGFRGFNTQFEKFFIYNMGNSKFNEFCNGVNAATSTNKKDNVYGFCKDKTVNISEEYFYRLEKLYDNDYVYFPNADNAKNFFSREQPRPMPSCKITGNPISIEFNKFKSPVKIKSFKLFEDGKEITDTKLLDASNDPNKMLSKFQFALYPLKVLKYNQKYDVKVEYIQDDKEKVVNWSFKTFTPTYPYFVIKDGDKIEIESDKWYTLFFEPNDCNDEAYRRRVVSSTTDRFYVEVLGSNTLNIKVYDSKMEKMVINMVDKNVTIFVKK